MTTMLLRDISCPQCGALPRGTLEIVVATFAGDRPDDEIGWSGDIDTDDSQTLYENGEPVLICQRGHTYQHPLFTDDVLCNLV